MKRFLTFLATFSLAETIGRHPAAAGILMLLGVGGGVGIAALTTPTITPQVSTYFNQNQALGSATNNPLRTNNNSVGAFEPPTTATQSVTFYGEMQVDSNLGVGFGWETPLANMELTKGGNPGLPQFFFQKASSGTGTNWLQSASTTLTNGVTVGAGTNYNTGLYPFTATGGGCLRQPTGVWQGFNPRAYVVDPGLGCQTAPTVNVATIPNAGAQQTGITATCASGGLGTLVTTSVPVSPGLSPGIAYSLSGFTTTAVTTAGSFVNGTHYVINSPGTTDFVMLYGAASNSAGVSFTATSSPGTGTGTAFVVYGPTLTTTSVTGSGPYTVVGTVAGTCPTISSTGSFATGTGASITLQAFLLTNPTQYGPTGVTTKAGQHVCFAMGEYGSDSNFPGGQFFSAVDENGNALPGAPSLFPFLNQGTANFTGSTVTTAQSTAITVTSISGSTMTTSTSVTLPTGASVVSFVPGFPATVTVTAGGTGTSFTVSASGSYSGSASSLAILPAMTVTAMNPYTITSAAWSNGASGLPASLGVVTFQVSSNPGFTSGSEIIVSGMSPSSVNGTYVATNGTSSTQIVGSQLTGPGGVPQAFSNPGAITTATTPQMISVIMPGMAVLGATAGSTISPYGTDGATGTGGTGTYALTLDQSAPISSSTIFAYSGFYYSAASSGNPAGGVATVRSQTTIGDFFGPIGSVNSSQTGNTGWGGTLGNIATLWGIFPQTTGGAPSTTALASLCKKTTTIPAFAAANSLTVHSLYELNDPGIFGESSLGDFSGTVNGTALAITSTPPATLASGTTISGAGITGCPSTCPTISSGSGSSYTLNTSGSASLIGPEPLKAGFYKPASPLAAGTFQGFLAGSTLTVTSYPTGAQTAKFTGSLGGASSPFTTLTINSGPTGTLQAGELITDGGASLTGPPLQIINGSGTTWTVLSNYNSTITSDTTMVASLNGLVPGSYIFNSGITTPIKITGYGTGDGFSPPTAAQAATGVTYTISNPAGLSIGSLGTPATFTITSLQDGAPVAPGPALTIRDQGPGVVMPVNFSTGTGTIIVSGTFDTSALGGIPTILQAQVSPFADPTQGAVPGCSACVWTNLTGYTSTLSSGTKFNWKGSAVNIPAGGPYYVSVRAANGTAYATSPNYFKIGVVVDVYGEGTSAWLVNQAGFNIPAFANGLWGGTIWSTVLTSNEAYLTGPPVLGTWAPSQALTAAGDRFGFNGSSPALAEGVGNFEQLMTNATGWPTTYLNLDRDGIGAVPFLMGNSQQNQTVGVGNGTLTTWCSATAFCANSSPSAVSVAGPLYYNVALLSGATLAGASISSNTLTVPATTGLVRGALMPGLILNVGTSLTLQNCLTGCTISNATGGSTQTWALSNTSGNALVPTRADPAGGAPWPASSYQRGGLPIALGGFGSFLVKAGTFSVSVNGTVVCTDSNAFAYNQTGGNCTGATIASSFVNYQTGDYLVTFSPGNAPAANAVVTASFTNIVAPEGLLGSNLTRPQGLDFVGDGGFQSGPTSAIYNRAPGGLSAHIYQSGQTDWQPWLFGPGYQFGAVGYTQSLTWLYTVKYPSVYPNMSAATPFVTSEGFRSEGNFWTSFGSQGDALLDQYAIDVVTKSTFSGTIGSGTLTLSGAAVGPMWEGEVIGGAGMTSPTGIYITGLATGTWGASGSTYNLSGAGSTAASGAMFNDVFWKGTGPAIYGGSLGDISVLAGSLASGAAGAQPHGGPGMAGGRRLGARLSSLMWGGLTSTPVAGVPPANSSVPTVDRVRADAINCDLAALAAPCLSVSGFPSTSSGNVAWTTGGLFTVTGGLAAHALPFVLGQSVTCSPSCGTGLVITSLSLPPTQDARSGQGQVGQTFTFNVSGTVTSSNAGTGTATGACSGTSGTSSNCILIAYKINTTAGTFGTSPALATCGENNLNGSSANFIQPTGVCSDNGIGTLIRDFNIGTVQNSLSPGGFYDDGIDFHNTGVFNPGAAFTCNIAAAKVIRCVKGTGVWNSGSTFIGGSEPNPFSGLISSVVGYVGGQSFPFTAGSGQTDGPYTVAAASNPTATGNGSVATTCAANTPSGSHTVTAALSSTHSVVTGTLFNLIGFTGIGNTAYNGSYTATAASTSTSLVGTASGATCPANAPATAEGTATFTCGTIAASGVVPQIDITIVGGVITKALPSTVTQSGGVGNGGSAGVCTFSPTTAGGTPGTVTIPVAPTEGVGGVSTFNTDSNTMGLRLYDNSGFPGNPLNRFFSNGTSNYFEPGNNVQPFGEFQRLRVSG